MKNDFLNLYSETNVGNKRPANEDFLGYSDTPNGLIYIVCDGMGGHVGGATASQLAVKSIIDFFSEKPYENIYVALSEAIVFANQEILKKAANEPELKGMGTTCTVLVAREPEIFIAHVGDSRIYLQSGDNLFRLTKDHSFVQDLVDQGVISDDEAESHPRKNQILKALGINQNLEPTVHSAPIHPSSGDKFLLCSDGLNGEINDEKIKNIFNSSNDINSVGTELIKAALNAGGKDNVTIEIIEVLTSPFEKSVFPNYNPVAHVKTDPNNNNLKTTIINNVSTKDFKSENNILKVVLSIAVLVIVIAVGLMISYTDHNEINVDNIQKVDQTVENTNETEKQDESPNINYKDDGEIAFGSEEDKSNDKLANKLEIEKDTNRSQRLNKIVKSDNNNKNKEDINKEVFSKAESVLTKSKNQLLKARLLYDKASRAKLNSEKDNITLQEIKKINKKAKEALSDAKKIENILKEIKIINSKTMKSAKDLKYTEAIIKVKEAIKFYDESFEKVASAREFAKKTIENLNNINSKEQLVKPVVNAEVINNEEQVNNQSPTIKNNNENKGVNDKNYSINKDSINSLIDGLLDKAKEFNQRAKNIKREDMDNPTTSEKEIIKNNANILKEDIDKLEDEFNSLESYKNFDKNYKNIPKFNSKIKYINSILESVIN